MARNVKAPNAQMIFHETEKSLIHRFRFLAHVVVRSKTTG